MFSRQCLGKRRIPSLNMLRAQARAWKRRVNRDRVKIAWKFGRKAARKNLVPIANFQAVKDLARHCRQRTRRYCNNRIESDHPHVKRRLRSMQGPRMATTAWAVIQGIEAAQMIRKGQVLGITRSNLYGQAWVFAALLGLK